MKESKQKPFDSQWFGFLLGMVLPIFGAYLFFVINKARLMTDDFLQFLKLSVEYRVIMKVLSVGAIANLVAFLISNNFDLNRTSRGIILATLIYALATIIVVNFF